MQTLEVIGGSGDCEIKKKRMRDELNKHLLPTDTYSHCNSSKSISLTVRGRMEARTESLDPLSIWSARKRGQKPPLLFVYPLWQPKSLKKQIFGEITFNL